MGLKQKISKLVLSSSIALVLSSTSAYAITFDLYNDLAEPAFSGTGEELAQALITSGSGINLVSGSSVFQGNFDGGGFPIDEGDFPIVEGPDGGTGEGTDLGDQVLLGSQPYGSASIYQDLNFGSSGGTDFVLPDGILLTSGFAAPAETNTSPSFEGFASGQGDAGLDALLNAGGFIDHTTRDATVLSFDFTVEEGINAISLDFIFGTEEYSEYIDDYPEIAAIFVDGVNYAGFSDGSLLTLTSQTVGAGNFFNNDIHDNAPVDEPLAIEYDGVSVPLTLHGLLDVTRETHTIKIAVSDTNDTSLDTGIFVANLQGLSLTGGTSAEDPILPNPNPDAPPGSGFEFIVDVGDTGFGIDPTQPIFIDPFVATGYEYEISSPVATVMIPNAYGDGSFNLYVWDGSSYVFVATLATGVTFDFLSNGYASGVEKFKIDGIEIGANLDPTNPNAFVTGVTFLSGGVINITQTPIVTCDGNVDCAASVPEPGVWLLMLTGLIGLRVMRRKS